ncbi:hypothetical protein SGL43_02190 [Streptomyces globisporus]|uniref:Transposase n=1 Tax=Streptomyces globisporus TaxID=1908 RepID=A0ABM9GUN0_STRGL|nr:hypothetical protein DER30_1110 [Streptomyces sp. HB202]CAH9415178.1 hypothetical protein SGL43_02190 [Streptomyces globisporus]
MHTYHPIEGDHGHLSRMRLLERPSTVVRNKSVDGAPGGRARVNTIPPEVSSGNQRNQEVRTLMTVVAVGTAHNRKSIVLIPVATG